MVLARFSARLPVQRLALTTSPRQAGVRDRFPSRGNLTVRSFSVAVSEPGERPRDADASPVGDWIRKKGPRADVKTLPLDPAQLRLSVDSIVNLSEVNVARFAELMNLYGAAVLAPRVDEGAEAYKTLDRLLGKCVSHDCMDERGIVEITPAKPTSINVAQPERPHLPHTDDAYTEQPARFITLQCREAAPSGGGESVLVSGAQLLGALYKQELRELMRPGMVSMGRRPAADGSWMKCSSIPMFWLSRDSGWLQLRWRCNDGCLQGIAPEAKAAYERMDEVARGEVHQLVVSLAPLDVLVVDNRANAHGRREYDTTEPRVMWRRNYYGDGELSLRLNVGMCDARSSLFDACSSMFEANSSVFDV
mmetsp:Transcript_155/g.588  ORF Transcript_155/g.588 Transcript_155/m.588 type:complete len:364 (+) Transcript_155:85-1176(+)